MEYFTTLFSIIRLKRIQLVFLSIFLTSTVASCLVTTQLITSSIVFAQNPTSENTTVTATVPVWDTTAPSTPILISPSNNSYLTVSKPDFVWQESTDNLDYLSGYGMNHYTFYLDGNVLFSNIPLGSTENSQYKLVYNSSTDQYTLTPKNAIAEGTHTWKIRATDYFGNYSESVTWTFTVDTQSPQFVLNGIGEAVVSISAQDVSTIPTNPVEIETNRPTLAATGEANSTVALTVTIPDQASLNYSTTIASNGTWSIELPLLPRDVVIYLSFTITDQAGNVSVLTNVPFIINTPVIIITPVLPTPTPTPTPTPEPGSTPGPEPVSTPEPTTPQIPSIQIPILPPEEIANAVITDVAQYVPPVFLNLAGLVPEFILAPLEESTPYAGLLVSALLPAVATAAVASQFGGGLSLIVLVRILQALGLLPKGYPQGFVYDSLTGKPIPFALITIRTYTQDVTQELIETVVTDVNGFYSGIKLPNGTYVISVVHQEYLFPSKKPRAAYLDVANHYLGEPFTISSQKQDILFFIPMDPVSPDKAKKGGNLFRLRLSQLSRIGSSLTLPLWFLSGLFALIYPSIWNTLVFGIYCMILGKRAYGWFRVPVITGVVIDSSGEPIEDSIIRISKPGGSNVAGVLRSNSNGEFKFYGQNEVYLVTIQKQDLIWVNDSQSPLSLYQADASLEPTHIIATMQPQTAIYAELFGERK